MENTYVIAWTSKLSASCGRGKKIFTREEAEKLSEELNEDYPNFIHEALNLHNLGESTPQSAIMTGSNVVVLNTDFSSSSSTVRLPTPDAEVA